MVENIPSSGRAIEAAIRKIAPIREELSSNIMRIKPQHALIKSALDERLVALRELRPGESDKELIYHDTVASFLSQAAGALENILDSYEAAIHGELHNLENELPELLKKAPFAK